MSLQHPPLSTRFILLLLCSLPWLPLLAAQTPYTILVSPTTPPGAAVPVNDNFFGISIELSIVNTLIGNDTQSILSPILNYLSSIRERMSNPLRIRIGGNSMDGARYSPTQTQMIMNLGPADNINDIPVVFGPVLFDVLKNIAQNIGGATYMLGLNLRTPDNDTDIVASAADGKKRLAESLDGFLLGNEPDLYLRHGHRPGYLNYTFQNYIDDFAKVWNDLRNGTVGNLLDRPLLAGPSICCFWELIDVLNSGWFWAFFNDLKYITVQHYPQDNCPPPNTYPYQLNYYLIHSNVVTLAQDNAAGVQFARSVGKDVLMTEFSTASCGGIPGISDTFGATIWTLDYVLQLASVNFSAAYVHTRESNITYNLFDPPAVGALNGGWVTGPPYYALLAVAEALLSSINNVVVDLDIASSRTLNTTVVAGYGIYENGTLARLVLLNYDTIHPATFIVPAGIAPAGTVAVRYLSAPNVTTKTGITWNGQTVDGQGVLVGTDNTTQLSCGGGCAVVMDKPGVAVVFLNASRVVPYPVSNDALSDRTFCSSFLLVPISIILSSLL